MVSSGMGGYWDRLERIKGWITWLQSNPIPPSEAFQAVNLMHLGAIEHATWEMVGNINPDVWGSRDDQEPNPCPPDGIPEPTDSDYVDLSLPF